MLQAAIWEMEERQLHERHQLAKRQLKGPSDLSQSTQQSPLYLISGLW